MRELHIDREHTSLLSSLGSRLGGVLYLLCGFLDSLLRLILGGGRTDDFILERIRATRDGSSGTCGGHVSLVVGALVGQLGDGRLVDKSGKRTNATNTLASASAGNLGRGEGGCVLGIVLRRASSVHGLGSR